MRLVLAIVLVLIFGAPALADDVTSARPQTVALVIYPQEFASVRTLQAQSVYRALDRRAGLALVTETRTVDVPAGPSRIRFEDVADGAIAETTVIEGLPAGLLEQNQDYDLLSPGALIIRSVGRMVRLERTDPATGAVTTRSARVLAGPNGVVLEVDGRLEALRCSGSPERIIFDGLPERLTSRPTLSVRIVSPVARRVQVRLSYLAVGFSWRANYVARVRPDGQSLDLSAWITLGNQTSTTFSNARVQVLAGLVGRADATRPLLVAAPVVATNCLPPWQTIEDGMANDIEGTVETRSMPMPPPPPPPPVVAMRAQEAVREDLGDYKLYTLPVRTTLAANQTKQVGLLSRSGVPFRRIYAYTVDNWNALAQPAGRPTLRVEARLDNSVAAGLGLPLPSGSVVWLDRDQGAGRVFAGEADVSNTAVGEPVRLALGSAMDAFVEGRRVRQTGRDGPADLEFNLRNDKAVPIEIEIQGPIDDRLAIRSESRPHRPDRGRNVWTFQLAPGGRATLNLTLQRQPD